jgi:uncharacterized protein (TIGR02231 family)
VVNSEIDFSQKTVDSQIVSATVYSDTALVKRHSVMSLTGQERELVITSLPVTLETESVRVSGAGSVAVRLLGVRCDRVFSTEAIESRVAQIQGQIQQLESEMSYLEAQIDGFALQSQFIEGLRDKTEEPFAQSLSRKNLSLSETMDFVNFLGSQYTEYGIATRDTTSQKQEIEKRLQALHQQLQQIQTPHPKESFSLFVGIEPNGAGEFELEVSYVVNRASWKPIYDIRVNTANNTINLGYLAQVTQNTGEDWQNVALTLSTAKPALGILPPKPEPWYINVPSFDFSEAMRTRTLGVPSPMSMTRAESAEPDEEVLIEAETVSTEVVKQGSVVTFKLTSLATVPSDSTPHKVTIFHEDFPCGFDYIAMPRKVSFAYLQANVKNPADGVTLLPGQANVFREDMFVGTANLENIAPNQEFKLNLGIDESLKIERELVERHVEKKLIGSDRRLTYAYHLVITNLQDQPINLKLTEQLPVSRNEQIKVRLNRSNPAIQVGKMGALEWIFTLTPGVKQEVYYQFVVEHPANLTIVGLDI